MKGLKFLVLPVLASLLLPLGNVHAALDLGDTVDSVVQEVESVLGESDLTIDTTYNYSGGIEGIETDDDYEDYIAGIGAASVIILFIVLISIAVPLYIYSSIALMAIGKKLDYKNSWFAWIPVLNVYMTYKLGDLSPWFLLLTIVPIFTQIGDSILGLFGDFVVLSLMESIFSFICSIGTLAVGTIAYMKISEKRGYDKWLGLLTLIPIANLVLMGILAWGKGKDKA